MWGLSSRLPGENQHSPHADRSARDATPPQDQRSGKRGLPRLGRALATPLALSARPALCAPRHPVLVAGRLAVAFAWSRIQLDADPRFPRPRAKVVPPALEGDVMNPREAFLERVRQAVHHGPRTAVRTVPPRAQLGYQGASPDPVGRFCQELAGAGGQAHHVGSAEEAWRVVEDIARRCQAKNVTLGQGGLVERLEIPSRLRAAGMDLTISTDPAQGAGPFFAADLGVTNVEYLIAETGT